MATKSIMVGPDWMKFTDGTQTASAQVAQGTIEMRDDSVKPKITDVGHPISGWIKVTPPTVAWVRAVGSAKVRFIVTYS